MDIQNAAKTARATSFKLQALSSDVKNEALSAIAQALKDNSNQIIQANLGDVKRAKADNIAQPLLKRLILDKSKIAQIVRGIESLIKIKDPVAQTLYALELDKGLALYKVSCPIGVIGFIFESRPDALVQIATLCLKSGNVVLLKGGSEAQETNRTMAQLIKKASEGAGFPVGWIHLLENRAQVKEMLRLEEDIDLIIPRGSNQFVRYIMDNTSITVLGHAAGICHIYIDEDVDAKMAVEIVVDSKCQYVAVCNALETLLIHRSVAGELLPQLKEALQQRQVELRGCAETARIIKVNPATEQDWKTEYLDYILSIRVVDSLQQAINHINYYGSGHTDAIITNKTKNASNFLNIVDSANVFWNCSTRFSDGYRYGFGAEVGISTNKIHARGPVGLEGLLIYKWKLLGTGQTVAAYSGNEAKEFTHKYLDTYYNL